MYDAGKIRGVFSHGGHIQEASDVGPAVADEDADPRPLTTDVPLRRVRALPHQRAPRCCQQPLRLHRCTAGIHHRLGDVLGAAEGTNSVDARAARLQRIKPHRVAETIVVQLDTQVSPQLAHALRDLHAHGEHRHVEFLVYDR